MFRFFAKQPFWVHLLVALALVFLFGYLFLQSLSWFTRHGEYLRVPAVKGKNVDEGIKLLESKGFNVVVQDSVYYDTVKKYTIIKQLPDPDATVKVNRTVFLTINRAIPPTIQMPKLEGLSLRYALDILERNHLKLEDTVYRPDFMKGSVLEQQYNTARIASGTNIPWGSKITLIIGGGLQVEQVLIPDVVGLSFPEAKALLEEKGINLAALVAPGVTDTATAFVYKQNPETLDFEKNPAYMQAGQTMDLWLSPVPLNLDSLKKIDQKEPLQ